MTRLPGQQQDLSVPQPLLSCLFPEWVSVLLPRVLGRAVVGASAYKTYGRAKAGIQEVLTSKCVLDAN